MRWELLSWPVSAGVGASFAAFLGPYVPGWAMAVGLPLGTLLFAVGTWTSDDSSVTWALRLTCAVTVGFAAMSIPLTLLHLSEQSDAALRAMADRSNTDVARQELASMWFAFCCMVPVGLYTLGRRKRRLRRGV